MEDETTSGATYPLDIDAGFSILTRGDTNAFAETDLASQARAGLCRLVSQSPALASYVQPAAAATPLSEGFVRVRGAKTQAPMQSLLAEAACSADPVADALACQFLRSLLDYWETPDKTGQQLDLYGACLVLRRAYSHELPEALIARVMAYGTELTPEQALECLKPWLPTKDSSKEANKAVDTAQDTREPKSIAGRLQRLASCLAMLTDGRRPRRRTGSAQPRAVTPPDEGQTPPAFPRSRAARKPPTQPSSAGSTEPAGMRNPAGSATLTAHMRRHLRAAHQGITFGPRELLQPIDYAQLGRLMTSIPHPLAAVLAAHLYGGPLARDVDSWTVARHVGDAQPGDSVALVIDPPGLLVANRINDTLPGPAPGAEVRAARSIFLPLQEALPGVCSILRMAELHQDRALFPPDWRARFREQIAPHRALTRTSFSFSQLRQALSGALRNVTGDHLLSRILSGTKLDVVHKARAHYRSTDGAEIAGRYVQACEVIGDWVNGKNRLFEQVPATPWPHYPSSAGLQGRIGSLRSPCPQDARAFIDKVAASVGSPPRGNPNLQAAKIRQFHNRYTYYVLTMALWLSASRTTNRAMEHFDGLDGYLLLDDKMTVHSGERMVPIARILGEQLVYYRRHCEWMSQWLKAKLPSTWFVFHGSEATPIKRFDMLPHRSHSMSTNAGRHFMATGAIKAGIPADRVNLMLGHWNAYDAPDDHCSHATPRMSSGDLDAFEAVANGLGWHALPGMGCTR